MPVPQSLALRKIRKSARAESTPIMKTVAQYLSELELSNKNLKFALSRFHLNTVKEVDVNDQYSALVVFYPLRFIRRIRKVQKILISELEKKFPGKHVVFIAQRKIAPPPKSNMARRQRSRCLTAVHDAILEDIVAPAEFCARRIHFLSNGSKVMQYYFEERHRDYVQPKIPTFQQLAARLTGRRVAFGFMTNPALQQISPN